jgi:hypothetical protein
MDGNTGANDGLNSNNGEHTMACIVKRGNDVHVLALALALALAWLGLAWLGLAWLGLAWRGVLATMATLLFRASYKIGTEMACTKFHTWTLHNTKNIVVVVVVEFPQPHTWLFVP